MFTKKHFFSIKLKQLNQAMNKKSQRMWTLVAQNDHLDIPRTTVVTPPFRIGRREGVDLCIPCRNVSSLHAEILEREDGLWIYDLNSTNGTFVNGERITKKARIEQGDRLKIGSCTYEVECSSIGVGRAVMSTIENVVESEETPLDRFDRLIDSGATPNFQPIVDISGKSIGRVGFEVLGRSRLFGLSTPDEMFGFAEELGLQTELSRVLRLRGFQVAENTLAQDQMLFVNTHPDELESDELIKNLKEVRKTFPNRPVVVEVPGTVLVDPKTNKNLLKVINELNIKLAIYDFGAQNVRLSTLNDLCPAIIKFDGALIQGIDQAPEKQRLVAAMSKMAIELGIIPMAEFVESKAEHETLRRLGVQYAQGFYYGRPTGIESVAKSESERSTEDSRSEMEKLDALMESFKSRPARKLKKLAELQELEAVASSNKGEQEQCEDDCLCSRCCSIENQIETKSEQVRVHGTEWLLNHPGKYFVVQLMTSTYEKTAVEFTESQTHEGDYAIYRKSGRNKAWYVVTYGAFESRAEAKEMAEQFQTVDSITWVRKMSALHAEIKEMMKLEA